MPIEIRELHIKAVVGAEESKDESGTSSAATEKNAGQPEQNAEQLIELCVEKIMEILKEKSER